MPISPLITHDKQAYVMKIFFMVISTSWSFVAVSEIPFAANQKKFPVRSKGLEISKFIYNYPVSWSLGRSQFVARILFTRGPRCDFLFIPRNGKTTWSSTGHGNVEEENIQLIWVKWVPRIFVVEVQKIPQLVGWKPRWAGRRTERSGDRVFTSYRIRMIVNVWVCLLVWQWAHFHHRWSTTCPNWVCTIFSFSACKSRRNRVISAARPVV